MFEAGDRIELVSMGPDPDPIKAGSLGTVLSCEKVDYARPTQWHVEVRWDGGRGLSLVCPPDVARRVDR